MTDTIDYYHAGEYTIDYSYQFIPMFRKTVHIPVTVLDVDSPVINMPEGSVYFIRTHDEFVLPEFTIEDSYDASEDIAVDVLGEVDTDTAGEYKLQIKACDASGNCSVSCPRMARSRILFLIACVSIKSQSLPAALSVVQPQR